MQLLVIPVCHLTSRIWRILQKKNKVEAAKPDFELRQGDFSRSPWRPHQLRTNVASRPGANGNYSPGCEVTTILCEPHSTSSCRKLRKYFHKDKGHRVLQCQSFSIT